MKPHVVFLVALGYLLMTASCSKYGCTDKAALNYDAKAKYDNGTCKYFTTNFASHYTGIDTGLYEINDSTQRNIITDTFQLISINNKGLQFFGFQYHIENLAIDTNPLNFIDSTDYGPNMRLTGYLNLLNDTLYYNMSLLQDTTLLNEHWGYGVKQ